MDKVRQEAVAGKFYPGRRQQLQADVDDYLKAAGAVSGPVPKAIIAPHAGYVYSGPIAGSAYAHLAQANGRVRRVILLGPAHWAPIYGLGASSDESFACPLGPVPLDAAARDAILPLPQVKVADDAHRPEHSLEVHLPFLQTIFTDFALVPLVVGQAAPSDVAEVLALLWGGPETVVVISSDLSHFHSYQTAKELDQKTSETIKALEPLTEDQACGRNAINGLLRLAKERGLEAEVVDLRNSGDTAGPRDRVVGYGAYVFHEGDG